MPAKPAEERVAREVTETLVKDDRVAPERAEEAVTFVLENEDVPHTDGLQIYRAARRHLLAHDVPGRGNGGDSDADDDGRPTLELPPRGKPPRKGTRKDTPAAKKERAK